MFFAPSMLALSMIAVASTISVCDLAVVGGGPGGAYVAWRYATVMPNQTVCLYEMGTRVGGRVHSMRNQGPKRDLVVEAGAYRFAPNETCAHFGNFTYCIYTPLTGHLILDALKLPTKRYNPLPGQWDSDLIKIADAQGHDAGYLTFVEAMVERVPPPNLKLLFGHQLNSIAVTPKLKLLSLSFAGSSTPVHAKRLVLNVPQRPLLRILSQSPSLFPPAAPAGTTSSHGATAAAAASWPAALTYPLAYPIVKLYLHYADAWWINDLNLRSGHFNNSAQWKKADEGPMASDDCIAARQSPYPLQGAYHDADVRCDGAAPAPRCRGFLQAAYMGDVQSVRLYEQFHYSGHDSAIDLDPSSRTDHRFLLDGVHEALVAVHADKLRAVGPGVYERVRAMRPDGGVASIWSERAEGLEAGCHQPRMLTPPLDQKDIPRLSLQPIENEPRILVANEAFGTRECWAEGSLVMAENALKRLGLGRPDWLPEDVYAKLIWGSEGNGDAERAEAEDRRRGKVSASDLMMLKAALEA